MAPETSPVPAPPEDKNQTPRATSNDPREVWSALEQSITGKHALNWVHSFTLSSLDQAQAVITPRPGKRQMVSFMTPTQCDRLSELLEPILGRRVRIQVQAGATLDHAPDAPTRDESAAPTTQPASRSDRDAAFKLPLVRQLADVFDVTLMDVHNEPDEKPTEEPSSGDETPEPI
ncbi:MAG: hypothetical protein GC164_00080 [Phycisphaera sp.]|nr:hypothetical protein [Phycisphaera sp.]